MIIGVVCQEKTLGYTMHKLHIQMPRFLHENSWRPITLTELATRSISFQRASAELPHNFSQCKLPKRQTQLTFQWRFRSPALPMQGCWWFHPAPGIEAWRRSSGRHLGIRSGLVRPGREATPQPGPPYGQPWWGSSEFVILGETPPCSRNSGCEEKRLFSWPALRVMIPSRSWAIELCSRAQGNSGLLPPLLLSLPPSPRWRNGGEGQSSPLVECECEMRESSGHQTPLWHSQKWAGKTNPWAAGGHGWIGSAPPVRADREFFKYLSLYWDLWNLISDFRFLGNLCAEIFWDIFWNSTRGS